ncbi:hypothetical protein KKG31_08245 [Patescibacteria group bacterium]|nr:hypothetical protein [Patescibacteria group bacterium]MBU1759048.1 hypothetical protein [Patescibacteria group bacterium]
MGKIQLIKDSVEIEALPKDLIHDITIDISEIKEMSETIFVKDLKVSDAITILDDMEQAILTVVALDEEEEEEEVVAPAEGEEGAEGEEAKE